MSYLAEIKAVQQMRYDTWIIVRISSATNQGQVKTEMQEMEDSLNAHFKDTSFKVIVGWDPDDMRRIYIKKLKKWKSSLTEEREYVHG